MLQSSLLVIAIASCQAFVTSLSPAFLNTMPPDVSRIRRPTVRQLSSTLTADETETAEKTMKDRTTKMMARAKDGSPLSESELNDVVNSLLNITPKDANVDWFALEKFLKETAHLSHKDWDRTGTNAATLAKILTPDGMTPHARQMFERILHEGNWDGAVKHALLNDQQQQEQPWAVLVTGVNGIRKTTSMYQPWFPQLLSEALASPPDLKADFPLQALPTGENSFFRQLDHMITTLCNEDFSTLYSLTSEQMKDPEHPSKDLVQKYSDLKAAIFSRYRTISELLGVLLLRQAQTKNINAMCETSGRDVAMFHYIDHFFPKGYNKLALHFTVNDLTCAQQSVDERMIREMKVGKEAVESGDVVNVIYANSGGPYGSEVLEGVQKDSDRVWNEEVLNGDSVGKDWYKATIAINAHPTEPWTAQAVRPDGSLGTLFTFGAPRVV